MVRAGRSPAEVGTDPRRPYTDGASARLSIEDLLTELLDKVREGLAVDMAVALLLDPTSRQLVVAAARGLEDDGLRDITVPLGRGFAGRIATSHEPMIIDNVVRGDVVNPLLIQHGVRSLLGVPLLDDDVLMGVLHVGTVSPRRFTAAEAGCLRAAADHVSVELRALLTRSEREAAQELQRSLLPADLPVLPGVEVAARYSPGRADVGGDWYDVFTRPSGELCLVMGDVAGHGLPAATVMGRMRSALRAYALESADPAAVLCRLDRMVQHFEPEATATVLYAVCHPALEWMRISLAGHWPPLVAAPGRGAALLDLAADPLIGADGATPRHTSTVTIPPDAMLCLYTDGLFERRDKPIDAGLTRLCQSVFLGHPDAVCAAVLASFVGQGPVEDDITLLMLRRGTGTG